MLLLSGRFRASPPQNIEVLMHHVCRLIILKIVTENVIFVDYQSKNVFRKNKHHNALAELDGHGQAEPF